MIINHVETEKRVMDFVVFVTRIGESDIRGPRRFGNFVRARAIYAHIMKRLGFYWIDIGENLHRDHTTAIALAENYMRRGYSAELEAKILANFPELRAE